MLIQFRMQLWYYVVLYCTLVALCSLICCCICRSPISELRELPKQWLDSVIADIKSGHPNSQLCATRRSAGVPFYIQVHPSIYRYTLLYTGTPFYI